MRLSIDRIEDGWAVCYTDDDDAIRLDIPLRYLPADVQAGDHLVVTFRIDREETEREKRRVEELLRELTRDHPPERKKFKL